MSTMQTDKFEVYKGGSLQGLQMGVSLQPATGSVNCLRVPTIRNGIKILRACGKEIGHTTCLEEHLNVVLIRQNLCPCLSANPLTVLITVCLAPPPSAHRKFPGRSAVWCQGRA